MGIIADIWRQCKSEWLTGLVLVLVALSAFGLGRLSALTSPKAPVELVATPASLNLNKNLSIDNNKNVSSGEVVASKEGSKYHYPSCPGAKQIKAGNKISFPTSAAARAAGYTPAGNCPNLN
jgi:hypothetical protein